jgi:hypothetical protein
MISYGGIGFEVSQRGSGANSWLNNGLKVRPSKHLLGIA